MKKTFTLLIGLLFTCSILSAQTVFGGFTWDGIEREYRLFIPEGYTPGTALPLVLNYHGFTSNAEQQEFYSDMNEVADTANFFVAYPEGIGAAWNVGWNFGSMEDDVGFTNALIDSLHAEYGINLDRVYSTGMSNGGFFSYRLACELNDRIAKIASVTGSMVESALDDCDPENPIPVMQIHGTADGVVAYNGSPGVSVGIEELLETWRTINGCTLESDTIFVEDINTNDGSTAQLIQYRDCEDEVIMAFYKVIGGAHTWPGAPIVLGTTNYDFNASEEIWHFFNDQYPVDMPIPTSIDPVLANQKLSIAPNPFLNYFYVHSSVEQIESIQVFNVLGKTVYSNQDVNTSNIQIENLDWKKGFYFVRIKTENSVKTIKVIKQ